MQLISIMIHVFKNMKNYDENAKMLLELTHWAPILHNFFQAGKVK